MPADEYLGGAGLGIASIAAVTPPDVEIAFHDDRVVPFDLANEGEPADLYALSFFTPAATRALELADMLRAAGRKTIAGGIFPTMMPELVGEHFDAVAIGEGEGVWLDVIDDVKRGTLRPRYKQTQPYDVSTLRAPRVDLYVSGESPSLKPDDYPLQISRGCPLACDACAIPGTLGRGLRAVPRETAKTALADLARFGKRAALTEDTSYFAFGGARRHFREFLSDLAEDPRPGHEKVSYIGISMPVLLTADPTLLRQMVDAGVNRFYLVGGFDPITRGAFGWGDPKAHAQAVAAIARCHEFGIEPYVSFLVGNEGDDEGVFDRMLAFTDEARVDKCEFAIATPYPGTPVWNMLEAEGRITSRTWKHYNDANVVFRPKQMTAERLQRGYIDLWREFYRSRQSLRNEAHHNRTIQF